MPRKPMPFHPAARLPTIDTPPALPTLPPTLRSVEHAVPAAGEAAGQSRFELFEHLGSNRATVEAFISQCFAESFGSRIEAFMPRLFSVRNEAGELCGAFGLRSASRNLFLEQYLDAPIEKVIAAHAGKRIERHVIVEVGHFSGTFPGAVRAMIALLAEDGTRSSVDLPAEFARLADLLRAAAPRADANHADNGKAWALADLAA